MDIRSFFGKPAQTSPAVRSLAALPVTGKKRQLAEVSASDLKLLAATKKKKAAKEKREAQKEASWYCSPQLMQWETDKSLYRQLDAHNTEQLKQICSENGLPRSGAKYKLRQLLLDHVREAVFRKECEETGPIGSDIAKQFAKLSTFGSAKTLFNKLVKSSLKIGSAVERMDTVLACVRGMDYQIFCAITGPNSKQYNGSRGEAGIHMHAAVAKALADTFVATCSKLEDERFDSFLDFFDDDSSSQCVPYGFDKYSDLIDLAALAKQHDVCWGSMSQHHKDKLDGLSSS